jgi:hypothetical protein
VGFVTTVIKSVKMGEGGVKKCTKLHDVFMNEPLPQCENFKQIFICFWSEKTSHEPMEKFWLNIDGSRTVDLETLN